MATSKSRESKTGPRPKGRKSKAAVDFAFPGEHERLPLHIPGAYQVAMGTPVEIVTWLRRVPRKVSVETAIAKREGHQRRIVMSVQKVEYARYP